jgi:Zn-dependent M28 family amino/carboxypeptidase
MLESLGFSSVRELEGVPALPFGLEGRIEVLVAAPQPARTANVLGLLPGSDPEFAREVLILGAHYDHVGDDPAAMVCTTEPGSAGGLAPSTTCEREEGRRYDGANDNASGVAVLLEIARLWREIGYQPRRSVLFAAWGAQEAGQIGSSFYVGNPVFPLEQTVATLQLDAVGGGHGYYLEAQGGGDREGLLLFNLMVAEELVDGRFAVRARGNESDQVPFQDAGIPTLLISWREASERNWPVELADEVQLDRLGITGRMVALAAMALAR